MSGKIKNLVIIGLLIGGAVLTFAKDAPTINVENRLTLKTIQADALQNELQIKGIEDAYRQAIAARARFQVNYKAAEEKALKDAGSDPDKFQINQVTLTIEAKPKPVEHKP
jgi:hypothetical protein